MATGIGIAVVGIGGAAAGTSNDTPRRGMVLLTAGMVWYTQIPVHGSYWSDLLPGYLIIGFAIPFAFIPVSIAALAGVGERDAGLASGLLNASQQIGGAIGVAVTSTVAASHLDSLARSGSTTPAALTGGFGWALWVCGAIGLAAVPIAFVLIRRDELAHVTDHTVGVAA